MFVHRMIFIYIFIPLPRPTALDLARTRLGPNGDKTCMCAKETNNPSYVAKIYVCGIMQMNTANFLYVLCLVVYNTSYHIAH